MPARHTNVIFCIAMGSSIISVAIAIDIIAPKVVGGEYANNLH
jgi:hypothetical protein